MKRLVEKCQNRRIPTLKTGEIVQVRSENEILATLDRRGALEGLSFSEEMRKYCGKRFRVLKQVNKIIVEGVGMGRMKQTVILERVTCDGEAHDACRKTCPLLWKEAWLRRMENESEDSQSTGMMSGTGNSIGSSSELSPCQLMNLLAATSPFHQRDLRLYLDDISSGAYSPLESLRVIQMLLSSILKGFLGRKNLVRQAKPRITPTIALNLQPGELVEVKSKGEILATLDLDSKNRGLSFTPEMTKYCGKRYRVLKRLDKMYIEQAGIMRQIANTVLLDGVTCDGTAHGGCLRTCYCLYREIWLRRVE
jgi:hypothetical protein